MDRFLITKLPSVTNHSRIQVTDQATGAITIYSHEAAQELAYEIRKTDNFGRHPLRDVLANNRYVSPEETEMNRRIRDMDWGFFESRAQLEAWGFDHETVEAAMEKDAIRKTPTKPARKTRQMLVTA